MSPAAASSMLDGHQSSNHRPTSTAAAAAPTDQELDELTQLRRDAAGEAGMEPVEFIEGLLAFHDNMQSKLQRLVEREAEGPEAMRECDLIIYMMSGRGWPEGNACEVGADDLSKMFMVTPERVAAAFARVEEAGGFRAYHGVDD